MRRRYSDTENKLLLLYAIDLLGPVTAQQILSYMVINELMDYISIQLGLAELMDSSLLRKQPHAIGVLYALTGKGHDTLTLFDARIPFPMKQRIVDSAEEWRQRFRREKQMLSSFEKTQDSEYSVRLRLLEWDHDLLDLRIKVPTHKLAQQFCDAWIGKATSIFSHIMLALGENKEETQSEEITPPDSAR